MNVRLHIRSIIDWGEAYAETPQSYESLGKSFMDSTQQNDEIVSSGVKPIPDPGGLSNAVRYDVKGSFNGSTGIWELVIDPTTNTIYHYNFR